MPARAFEAASFINVGDYFQMIADAEGCEDEAAGLGGRLAAWRARALSQPNARNLCWGAGSGIRLARDGQPPCPSLGMTCGAVPLRSRPGGGCSTRWRPR